MFGAGVRVRKSEIGGVARILWQPQGAAQPRIASARCWLYQYMNNANHAPRTPNPASEMRILEGLERCDAGVAESRAYLE